MHLQTIYVPDDCQWLQCVCAQIPNAFTINKVGMLSWSRRGDRGDKESPRDPHKDFSVSPRLVATLCSFYVGLERSWQIIQQSTPGDSITQYCGKRPACWTKQRTTPDYSSKRHLTSSDTGVAIPERWQLVLDHATMISSTHAVPRLLMGFTKFTRFETVTSSY